MSSAASPAFVYPVTKKGDKVDEYWGTKIADPYQWLEAPDAPETEAWVKAQNAVTSAFLKECPAKEKLESRLKELYNFERFSCPFRRGDWIFFFRNSGLQNQSVLYKQRGFDGKEEELLDPNRLSDDGTAALGTYGLTESGSMLAYGVSQSGSDWQTISVINVADGSKLKDELNWVKFSGVSWTHDEKGFFYSRYPTPTAYKKSAAEEADPNFKRGTETESVKNHQVYYHRVGSPQADDVLVHCTPDFPEWTLGAEVTDDGFNVVLTMSESCDTKNRLYLLPLNVDKSFSADLAAEDKKAKLFDSFVAEYSYITNEGSKFFFRTNRDAGKYRLVEIDVSLGLAGAADPATWRTVIPEHDKDVLESVRAVNHTQFAVVHSHDVAEVMSLWSQSGTLLEPRIDLPDVGSIAGIGARKEDATFFYHFSSFLYAGIIMRVELTPAAVLTAAAAAGSAAPAAVRASSVFREISVRDFNARDFETQQVFYPSKDGTMIPMFIVKRKGLKLDGTNPTWLYGYGGFNISLPPSFSVARVAWMDHFNGVFALANLRGGGEYGEAWYKAGVLTKKQNVFDDFIAAAEYLIEHKYTSSSKLAINGGSNGGLLVCACLNQRPDLFGAVIGQVGVLDMLKFNQWTIGYAWTSDYGSSAQSEDMFKYLRAYSPVHNVDGTKTYPPLLLCTSDHDDRVVPLHSYKYIAEVQSKVGARPDQTAPLLIRIEEKAGHGAGLPLSKRIVEQADSISFMARVLGANANFK